MSLVNAIKTLLSKYSTICTLTYIFIHKILVFFYQRWDHRIQTQPRNDLLIFIPIIFITIYMMPYMRIQINLNSLHARILILIYFLSMLLILIWIKASLRMNVLSVLYPHSRFHCGDLLRLRLFLCFVTFIFWGFSYI